MLAYFEKNFCLADFIDERVRHSFFLNTLLSRIIYYQKSSKRHIRCFFAKSALNNERYRCIVMDHLKCVHGKRCYQTNQP